MNWKAFLNVLLTAIISGAVTGLAQHYGTGVLPAGPAGAIVGGAAVAVANQLRTPPATPAAE